MLYEVKTRVVHDTYGVSTQGDITNRLCPAIMVDNSRHLKVEYYLTENPPTETAIAPRGTKPPYAVPTMADIAAVPWNGYTVASLFSGCGGSCLGFRMAGFRVVYANEFVAAARDSYRANAPDTFLDPDDVRRVTAKTILAAAEPALESLGASGIDILEGSPPCASFSTAGNRESDWGKVKPYSDTHQRTDDLFFEYARIVRELQPKVFVAENVSGLVKGAARGYFLDIFEALRACGYRVACRGLDAQWLGVPQMRKRVIFIGVRDDLHRLPAFPKPLPYRYSVRDALPWIVRGKYGQQWRSSESPSPCVSASLTYDSATSHQGLELVEVVQRIRSHNDGRLIWHSAENPSPAILATDGARDQSFAAAGGWIETQTAFVNTGKGPRSIDEPSPSVLTHNRPKTESELTLTQRGGAVEPEADITRYAIGAEWEKLNGTGQSEKYFQLTRPSTEAPCGTITQRGGDAGVASVTHPTEKRKFSIAELKRICAFPDDFILTGTYPQQWERLGRAVPPVMMRAVAEVIRDQILNHGH